MAIAGRSLTHAGGGLAKALARLDRFANGASFVLGHNLIAFDLPHLRAAKPGLRLLGLPAVDTSFARTLKGVGKVYIQTVLDCFRRHVWASSTRARCRSRPSRS